MLLENTKEILRYLVRCLHIEQIVLTNYTSLQSAINSASDIDELKALYTSTNGASQDSKSIDATSSGVVSTSDNTITINGHGFVNDEVCFL